MEKGCQDCGLRGRRCGEELALPLRSRKKTAEAIIAWGYLWPGLVADLGGCVSGWEGFAKDSLRVKSLKDAREHCGVFLGQASIYSASVQFTTRSSLAFISALSKSYPSINSRLFLAPLFSYNNAPNRQCKSTYFLRPSLAFCQVSTADIPYC